MNKLLTIGMATYDDFDGVYFTIQSLKMYHDVCNTDQVEFIVIDNNPESKHGEATKNFVENWARGRYLPVTNRKTTAIRNEIFKNALGRYTLCVDPHVLIFKDGINNLLNYYQDEAVHKNIVSGPLVYDDLKCSYTHFNEEWRGHMYGTWGFNKEAYEAGKPFEIPMQGLGLFSCKTKNWLGFNEYFTGFGAEEGYIHEKFRLAGGKAVCLPSLKWVHRFGRPNGVPYRLVLEDRVWNYFIGWLEIYKDPGHKMINDIYNYFKKQLPEGVADRILNRAILEKDKWK